MAESCPAYTPLEQGCTALPAEPASRGVSTLEFIVTRWDMSLLQSGGCKGAGHTLALTLTGCTKVGRQLNRQAGIRGKLSTKKGAQGQNLSNCLCFPAREGCL